MGAMAISWCVSGGIVFIISVVTVIAFIKSRKSKY